jgi:protein-S-isoprenylcysteine O-methyltransferase Ste14
VNAAPAGAPPAAWAGAALFAGSLAYFLFTYAVTFGEITVGDVNTRAIAVDVVLFTVFALHHSVFARDGIRARIVRTVSAQLERSVYVWVASLMLIAVCALWQPIAGVAWAIERPAAWLFPVVQLAGAWLTFRSAALIDIWDLAGVRQAALTPDSQRPAAKAERSAHGSDTNWELGVGTWEFKTDGPYGWVRHPIYLGWLLLVFPVATMTMTRLLFAVVSSAYIVLAIPFEERSLRQASGGAYDAYIRAVRWKLIPGVY